VTAVKPRAPRSKLVPFIPGEDPEARHERRLDAALDMVTEAKRGLDPLGLELFVSPDGRHWKVSDRDGRLAEWWPKTGRFVALARDSRPMKFHDVPGFLRGVRLSMGLRRVVPTRAPEAPPQRFQQAPLVREPLPVELDGEVLGYILKVRASWTALCLDRRPLSGVEHRGKHWAISEVCGAAMPTGYELVAAYGAYSYRWLRGADLSPGMVATPQEAVRQAREHAAELALRRSPRALLEQLAGSSA
jgi:hypothetical protein